MLQVLNPPPDNPATPVGEIKTRQWIDAAQEGSPYAAADAVISEGDTRRLRG